MRTRRLAVPAMVAVLLALTSACSAALPPRTTPDSAERAALAGARQWALHDGIPIAADIWTQLWTPTQAGTVLGACVTRGSGGDLTFATEPLALESSGLSYSIGPSSNGSSSRAFSDFDDQRAVLRIVDSCIAAYPVDFRLGSVPARDRDALYSYDLTFLRRCLIAHGHRVPRLPNRTRFENLMKASAPWNAYDLVVVEDRAGWYALADACPALPAPIANDVSRDLAAITRSASAP